MTTPLQGVIRQSELLGRLVLDRATAEEIGRVDRLWLDPKARQIVGMTCLSGLVVIKQRSLNWSQIDAIGTDSILVEVLNGVEPKKPITAISEFHQEVWTDTGTRIGTLVDYRFDPETGDLIDYLFTPIGWQSIKEGTYKLLPDAIISINDRRLIISEEVTQSAEPYSGGIKQGVVQITELLKEDYVQTQQDFQAIASNLKISTEKVAERLKAKLADVADRLQHRDSEPSSSPIRLDEATTETLDVEVIASEPVEFLEPIDSSNAELNDRSHENS